MNESFLQLSAALTGFSRVDLQGTGVVDEYWATVIDKAGQQTADDLLAAWQIVQDADETIDTGLRNEILSNSVLGPVAHNIIIMWYTGQWGSDNIVSAQAYQQGLVWDAIGAHTQGAKQQGFGTWSLPPKGIVEACNHE